VDFAAQKHRDQRRKDAASSPYINHPVAVARLIAEVGQVHDPEILAAALLHDTIEDTETNQAELRARFGDRVCRLVVEVSDDMNLRGERRKQLQVEHAHGLSQGAALIKLADKICNVRDVTHAPPAGWDRARRLRYLEWARAVVENCPRVNAPLRRCFDSAYVRGMELLGSP